MKKKSLKSLKLNKESISNLERDTAKGGVQFGFRTYYPFYNCVTDLGCETVVNDCDESIDNCPIRIKLSIKRHIAKLKACAFFIEKLHSFLNKIINL